MQGNLASKKLRTTCLEHYSNKSKWAEILSFLFPKLSREVAQPRHVTEVRGNCILNSHCNCVPAS